MLVVRQPQGACYNCNAEAPEVDGIGCGKRVSYSCVSFHGKFRGTITTLFACVLFHFACATATVMAVCCAAVCMRSARPISNLLPDATMLQLLLMSLVER